MIKDYLIYIVLILLLVISVSKIFDYREELNQKDITINYFKDQLSRVKKANEEKMKQYQLIDEEYERREEELRKLLEEANEDTNWLHENIPNSIDNTIPY